MHSLTAIIVDNNNANYAAENGILFNNDMTILLCYPDGKTETNYTIPNSVISIGFYAFYNCISLTNIIIPNSVTSIGSNAFYNCNTLTLYCEVVDKPNDWHSSWNYSNRPVIWGCMLGNDSGSIYIVSFTKTLISIINPTAPNGIKAPYREGYTFEGWATSAGSTIIAYTASSVNSAPNNTTLYAIWTKNE